MPGRTDDISSKFREQLDLLDPMGITRYYYDSWLVVSRYED